MGLSLRTFQGPDNPLTIDNPLLTGNPLPTDNLLITGTPIQTYLDMCVGLSEHNLDHIRIHTCVGD